MNKEIKKILLFNEYKEKVFLTDLEEGAVDLKIERGLNKTKVLTLLKFFYKNNVVIKNWYGDIDLSYCKLNSTAFNFFPETLHGSLYLSHNNITHMSGRLKRIKKPDSGSGNKTYLTYSNCVDLSNNNIVDFYNNWFIETEYLMLNDNNIARIELKKEFHDIGNINIKNNKRVCLKGEDYKIGVLDIDYVSKNTVSGLHAERINSFIFDINFFESGNIHKVLYSQNIFKDKKNLLDILNYNDHIIKRRNLVFKEKSLNHLRQAYLNNDFSFSLKKQKTFFSDNTEECFVIEKILMYMEKDFLKNDINTEKKTNKRKTVL